jgi:hypothetical protein
MPSKVFYNFEFRQPMDDVKDGDIGPESLLAERCVFICYQIETSKAHPNRRCYHGIFRVRSRMTVTAAKSAVYHFKDMDGFPGPIDTMIETLQENPLRLAGPYEFGCRPVQGRRTDHLKRKFAEAFGKLKDEAGVDNPRMPELIAELREKHPWVCITQPTYVEKLGASAPSASLVRKATMAADEKAASVETVVGSVAWSKGPDRCQCGAALIEPSSESHTCKCGRFYDLNRTCLDTPQHGVYQCSTCKRNINIGADPKLACRCPTPLLPFSKRRIGNTVRIEIQAANRVIKNVVIAHDTKLQCP